MNYTVELISEIKLLQIKNSLSFFKVKIRMQFRIISPDFRPPSFSHHHKNLYKKPVTKKVECAKKIYMDNLIHDSQFLLLCGAYVSNYWVQIKHMTEYGSHLHALHSTVPCQPHTTHSNDENTSFHRPSIITAQSQLSINCYLHSPAHLKCMCTDQHC